MLYKPRVLKKGDGVALIAPSSPVEPEKLQNYVNEVKKLGLNVDVKRSCYQFSHKYLSGSDDLRASDIMESFLDKSIKGIFCIRGGYGAGRLLGRLDFGKISKNPKFFCGYSDITALHIAINQNCRFITYHTPMPNKFEDLDDYSFSIMESLIFCEEFANIPNPESDELKFINEGSARGILTGGNLSLLTASLATKYEINTRGKILFIEEVDEEAYKIDRMLNHLHMAGKFRDCAGIIFGNFEGCVGVYIPEIIKNWEFTCPIIGNFRAGHGLPSASLPMGAFISIDSAKQGIEILW